MPRTERVILRGGPHDGLQVDVHPQQLGVRLAVLENPADQRALTLEDYLKPDAWELVFGRFERKDRPRFGTVTYTRTEEREGACVVFR